MAKTKLETVAEMWASYRRDVLPADAPPIQIQECQRAFYGGVAAMFGATAYGVAERDVSVEAGMEYLTRIDAELRAYGAGLPTEPRRH